MRLVNADALLGELEKYSDPTAMSKNDYQFGMQQRLETCIELIEDAPTVDAVEVVRCRECRWRNMGECEHKFGLLVSNDENYCSYGERDVDI